MSAVILSLNTSFTQQTFHVHIISFFVTENIYLYSKQGADHTQKERKSIMFLCIPLNRITEQWGKCVSTNERFRDKQSLSYPISVNFHSLIDKKQWQQNVLYFPLYCILCSGSSSGSHVNFLYTYTFLVFCRQMNCFVCF